MALDVVGTLLYRIPSSLSSSYYTFENLGPISFTGRRIPHISVPLGALAFNIYHPGDDVDIACLTHHPAEDFWDMVAERFGLRKVSNLLWKALFTGVMELDGNMTVLQGSNVSFPAVEVLPGLGDYGWKEICDSGTTLRIRYVHVPTSYNFRTSFGRGPINCSKLSAYLPSYQTPGTAAQEHAAWLHDTVYLASTARLQSGDDNAGLEMRRHIREMYDTIRQYADASGVFSPRWHMGVLNSELLVWIVVRCVRKIDLELDGDRREERQADTRVKAVLTRLCALQLWDGMVHDDEFARKAEGVVFRSHAGRNLAAHISPDGAHAITTWLRSLQHTDLDILQAYNRNEGLDSFITGYTTFVELGVSCWIDDPTQRLAFNEHALDIIADLATFVRFILPVNSTRLWPHSLMDTQATYNVKANMKIFLIGLGAERTIVVKEESTRWSSRVQHQLDNWLAEIEYDRAWGYINIDLRERKGVERLWHAP